MTVNLKRFQALVKLGNHLLHFDSNKAEYSELNTLVNLAIASNGWFTLKSIEKSFLDWGNALKKTEIESWINSYNFFNIKIPKKIALILAGNIPLVGFHDIICVWLSGHKAIVKCASKDKHLLPYFTNFLEVEAKEKCFDFTKRNIKGFDAVIATGSNNSSRYFEYYFGSVPNIIRKNRNGVAVLDGSETKKQLKELGNDILHYFGLGCRNVSKLYIPKDYDLNLIFEGLFHHAEIIKHPKYANNYDYNKAIFLMSDYDFRDNGFFVIRESKEFSAPIACLYYEYYSSNMELNKNLEQNKESIQCIVSNLPLEKKIDFGFAQKPSISDYADGIDTLSFLNDLN